MWGDVDRVEMAQRINKLFLFLSTMGPIGYLKGPGTMATLATLPVLWWSSQIHFDSYYYAAFIIINIIIAFYCIQRSLNFFTVNDPSQIVIDEYIGCLITFFLVPVHFFSLIVGFLLFRFFDIAKCFGIKSCEKVKGASGILLDDILAGIFANVCLQIILIFTHGF